MKLLIIFSSMMEATPFLAWLFTGKAIESDLKKLAFEKPYALFCYELEGIQIDAVIVGHSNFETAFHISRILQVKRYHLALQVGTAISNENSLDFGSICNVINDHAVDFGIEKDQLYQSAYAAEWLNKTDFPHQMGGFINKTNSYFNVFLDFKKVAGASVNTLYPDNTSQQDSFKKDNLCHIHYLNGIGFSFACLYSRQAFYQLRVIANRRTEGIIDSNLAMEIATKTIIETIKKIA